MKNVIIGWILLIIHKKGLCKPFHYEKDEERHINIGNGKWARTIYPKGFCVVLGKAYKLLGLESLI